ncbi:YadA-like family protein [Mannheimia sp. AT1]|uniref:YadA-like family protein n=1 Tax=Mannheimia cairinae TaxID=3025936 RepID=A0ABT5MNZ9_9PAST|nr:YadA-like family protein [Mannheimia cairinae]MDD0823905.1 YadA-like family protein [Mannheimia cairinae]
MNNIYRVIWNASTQSWQAVSEFAKTQGKSASTTVGNTTVNNTPAISLGGKTLFAFSAIMSSMILLANPALAATGETTAAEANAGILEDGNVCYYDYSNNNVICGDRRTTDNDKSNVVVLGKTAQSTGNNAVSIGNNAVTALNSTAVGYNSLATGNSSTALGNDSRAAGESAVAIGNTAKAEQVGGIAIGTNANARQNRLTAEEITKKINSSLLGNVVIGNGAVGGGHRPSIAIGADAAATEQGVAIGWGARANQGSSALGDQARATGDQSLALGANTTASGDASIAIGGDDLDAAQRVVITVNGRQVTTANAFQQLTGQALPTGYNDTTASGPASVALGTRAKAIAAYTTAFGTLTEASGLSSTAIGLRSISKGDGSLALGTAAQSSGKNSIAFGTSKAFVENAIAIGKDANATHKNSVALGSNSVTAKATAQTKGTVNSITYGNFAGVGSAESGSVSVGKKDAERQIKHIAAGEISDTSTDAINGSQLYMTNDVLGNLANSVVNNFGGNAKLNPEKQGDITFTNIGDTGKDNIHNAIKFATTTVKAGNNTTVDKTEGANEYTVNAWDTTVSAKTNGGVTVTPTINEDGMTRAYKLSVNVDGNTIKLDDNGKLVVNKDAIDTNTVTTLVDGNHTTVTNTAKAGEDPVYKVDVKTSTLSNNTDGKVKNDGNDLVTADQVANAINNSGFNVVAAGNKTEGASDFAKELINPGDTVTLEAGKNLTVKQENGRFTFATSDDVTFTTVKAGDTTINNDGLTITGGPTITKDNVDVASNKITNVAAGVDDADAVNVSQLKASQATNQAATTWKINTSGQIDAEKGAESVSNQTVTVKHGINTKVSEVKKDANGNYSYEIDVTGLPMEYVDAQGNTLVNVGGKFYSQKEGNNGELVLTPSTPAKVRISSDKPMQLTNVDKGEISATSTDAINGSQLHETNQNVANNTANIAKNKAEIDKGLDFAGDKGEFNRKLGQKTTIKGGITDESKLSDNNIGVIAKDGTLEVKLAKDIKIDSVSIKSAIKDQNGNTQNVTLDQNGLNNGGNRIVNVAPGVDGTDAVNVNQLKGVANNLNNRMHKVDKNLRAGIAGALASGDLPQPYLPGKSMIALGAGSYRGESAIAIGASRNSDNGKWIIKGSANTDSRGHVGVSGSVGYQF